MNPLRKTAIATGVLFLVTHVTSVGARALYGSGLSGTDTALRFGALLEVVLAVSVVGTSIALYPVAKRVLDGVALGYVALRTLEAGVILFGVVMVLGVVGLRESSAPVSEALVTLEEWAFVVGPGLVCGVNTVLMAYIMYRSGLVPRFIAVLGLIGGPLVFAANVVKIFGQSDQLMPWIGVTVVPIFAWEICLAVYLIAKGFRPDAVARLQTI